MVYNPNADEINLKVFNTAKKFAEEVLFPLMFDFKKFQRQANFGHADLETATSYSEEIREIQRFNGLKAMVETVHDLLYSIASTVRAKGNKQENTKMDELIKTSDEIKLIFYHHRERFFDTIYRDNKTIDILNREYFEKLKDIIDVIYVNAEILMTRNKLLFADANDEFLSDDQIRNAIKEEYINN